MPPKEIHKDFMETLGKESPSCSTVKNGQLILLTLLTLHLDLNISNVYLYNMVSQILIKLISLIPKPHFLDLHLSISNNIVSTKICGKRDDFDFEIVNFPFLDGHAPRSTSYGVYISQFIRFAKASSYISDFNTRNKLLTQKLLKQCYRYHNFRKTFSKFYR